MTEPLNPQQAKEITRKLALAKLVDLLENGRSKVGWCSGTYCQKSDHAVNKPSYSYCAIGMLGLIMVEEGHYADEPDADPRSNPGGNYNTQYLREHLGKNDFDVDAIVNLNDECSSRYEVAREITRRYLS